jgi:hypothetical protein
MKSKQELRQKAMSDYYLSLQQQMAVLYQLSIAQLELTFSVWPNLITPSCNHMRADRKQKYSGWTETTLVQ